MTKEQLKSVIIPLNRLRAKEQITDEEYIDLLYPILDQHHVIEYVPWWSQPYTSSPEPFRVTCEHQAYESISKQQ